MKLKTTSRIDVNTDKRNRENQNLFFEIMQVTIDEFKNYQVRGRYYYRKSGARFELPEFLNFTLRRNQVEASLQNFESVEAKFIDKLEEALYVLSIPIVNSDWGVENFELIKNE
jgi:hypothetical protein